MCAWAGSVNLPVPLFTHLENRVIREVVSLDEVRQSLASMGVARVRWHYHVPSVSISAAPALTQAPLLCLDCLRASQQITSHVTSIPFTWTASLPLPESLSSHHSKPAAGALCLQDKTQTLYSGACTSLQLPVCTLPCLKEPPRVLGSWGCGDSRLPQCHLWL